MEANEASAAAAVSVLTAELQMANGNIESLDRKAALVPPAVAVAVALFVAPDATFTAAELVIVVIALLAAALAIGIAFYALEAKSVSLGGDAVEIAAGDHLAPAAFNHAAAASLATAVKGYSELTLQKAGRLNWAMRLAAVTFLLLAIARVAGGI